MQLSIKLVSLTVLLPILLQPIPTSVTPATNAKIKTIKYAVVFREQRRNSGINANPRETVALISENNQLF
jgi:hypothetical protein